VIIGTSIELPLCRAMVSAPRPAAEVAAMCLRLSQPELVGGAA
jgi:hypothetical protein